jgi:hypothetical protein
MRNYDVVLSILCFLFHVVVLNDYLEINNAINTG